MQGPAGSIPGFVFLRGSLPSSADGVIHADSQFTLLYDQSREALAYKVAGATFYGGTSLKTVYTLIIYIVVGGVTSRSKSLLRTIRPGIEENLYPLIGKATSLRRGIRSM